MSSFKAPGAGWVICLIFGLTAEVQLHVIALPQGVDSQVDALFVRMSQSNWPGAAVLVSRKGKIILDKGYGFAQCEARVPITTDTRMRIGSLTKQFTAAAIFKLAEARKLTIDDPISKVHTGLASR